MCGSCSRLRLRTGSTANSGREPATKQQIDERLVRSQADLADADMPACVHAAVLLRNASDATSRLVVIVTDGTAHGWSAESAPVAGHPRLGVARDGADGFQRRYRRQVDSPFSNLSIEKLSMSRTRLAVGESFAVTARVRNTGDVPRKPPSLKWEIDGQPSGESQVAALGTRPIERRCLRDGLRSSGSLFIVGPTQLAKMTCPATTRPPSWSSRSTACRFLVCRSEADLATSRIAARLSQIGPRPRPRRLARRLSHLGL